jgi:RNA polymerase sigma-70 factor (ECF subfamily)
MISRDAADRLLQEACGVYRIAWNMLGSAVEAMQVAEEALLLSGGERNGIALEVILLRAGRTRPSGAESFDHFLPRFDIEGCFASLPVDRSEQTEPPLRCPVPADAIRAMLQRLDPLDRAAFILREIERAPLEETADLLRLSAEEVRARTHRASLLLTGMLAAARTE